MSWTLAIILLGAGSAAGWLQWLVPPRTTLPTREAVFREAMARIDSDGDGRISLKEWEKHGGSRELFEMYDFNADGSLDVTEFEALFTSAPPRPRP